MATNNATRITDDVIPSHGNWKRSGSRKTKFLAESIHNPPILPGGQRTLRNFTKLLSVEMKYPVITSRYLRRGQGLQGVQTTGAISKFTRIGRLEFEDRGRTLSLVAALPPPADERTAMRAMFSVSKGAFRHGETTEAQRYLRICERRLATPVLDFNRAYNPYWRTIAYYSCQNYRWEQHASRNQGRRNGIRFHEMSVKSQGFGL